jgi:hypothetical protein
MAEEKKKYKNILTQWMEAPAGTTAIAANETDDAIINKVESRMAGGEDVSDEDKAALAAAYKSKEEKKKGAGQAALEK